MTGSRAASTYTFTAIYYTLTRLDPSAPMSNMAISHNDDTIGQFNRSNVFERRLSWSNPVSF
jgi:hypothetical protein